MKDIRKTFAFIDEFSKDSEVIIFCDEKDKREISDAFKEDSVASLKWSDYGIPEPEHTLDAHGFIRNGVSVFIMSNDKKEEYASIINGNYWKKRGEQSGFNLPTIIGNRAVISNDIENHQLSNPESPTEFKTIQEFMDYVYTFTKPLEDLMNRYPNGIKIINKRIENRPFGIFLDFDKVPPNLKAIDETKP